MRLTKILAVFALATTTGVGAAMLAPTPAEAISPLLDCPANHLRCFNGACTLGAPLFGCEQNGTICVETWYGSDPSCQT